MRARCRWSFGGALAAALLIAIPDAGADPIGGRSFIVIGKDGDRRGAAEVFVYDADTSTPLIVFQPFGPAALRGGVQVAAGDLNGDGVPDIIVGTGRGHPQTFVHVYDGATLPKFHEPAVELPDILFTLNFPELKPRTGISVAAGDIDGDGVDDLVVVPQTKDVPEVRVFTGPTQILAVPFEQIPAPARIAVGDLDGDGIAEVIVGAGQRPKKDQFHFYSGPLPPERPAGVPPTFWRFGDIRGGVHVAVGDLSGRGRIDVIFADTRRDGGLVQSYDPDGNDPTGFWFPFGDTFRGGVRVASVTTPSLVLAVPETRWPGLVATRGHFDPNCHPVPLTSPTLPLQRIELLLPPYPEHTGGLHIGSR